MDECSSVAFIIDKNAMDNDIFTGVLAMLRMIGESTSVFVLSDAIRLNVFHAHLSSFQLTMSLSSITVVQR